MQHRHSTFHYLLLTLLTTTLFSVSSTFAAEQPAAAKNEQAETENSQPQVIIETTLGSFTVQLNPEEAPVSVANFLAYVDEGFYTSTLFHRVIPGFMAQGGGMESGMVRKAASQPAIENESIGGLSNKRGTLAMARTGDPHSATSQFFVNVVDNMNLDARGNNYGYAVFGEVVDGMDIVDKIVSVPTTSKGMYRDVPVEDVVILSTTRVQSMPAASEEDSGAEDMQQPETQSSQ